MSSSLRIRESQLDALRVVRRQILERRIAAQLADLAAKWRVPCSHSRLGQVTAFAVSRAPEFELLTDCDVFRFACLVLMADLDAPPSEANRWVWTALRAKGVSGTTKLERIYSDSRTASLHPSAGAADE